MDRTADVRERARALWNLAAGGATDAVPVYVESLDVFDTDRDTYPAGDALLALGSLAVPELRAFLLRTSPVERGWEVSNAAMILRKIVGDAEADRWAEGQRHRVHLWTYQCLMSKET